ncbi:hypothetical protein TNCV_436401 [Trichonephila clavipes]|nr:hypothetical protein TNCV_436401 [Trichonephila clavipes]
MWQRTLNFKLYQSYKESDIVNVIKIQPMKSAGHVARMDKECTTKKSSMPNQLSHEERAGHILDGLMAQKRSPSFENKELENTIARRRMA